MERYAVIGDPVVHSLSPYLFRRIAEETDRELSYEAVQVREGELADFLTLAKHGAYAGVNATMPHKSMAAALADERGETVQRLGAANALRFSEGKIFAENTDGAGFLTALHWYGIEPKGNHVLLLGAGGAARAVALALASSGAKVKVLNRTKEKASAMAALHENISLGEERDLSTAALLVNATPRGMTVPWEDLGFLDRLGADSTVMDLVYAPRETELLAAARKRGLAAYNGFAMLAGQALRAAEFFFAEPLDDQALLPKLLKEERRN